MRSAAFLMFLPAKIYRRFSPSVFTEIIDEQAALCYTVQNRESGEVGGVGVIILGIDPGYAIIGWGLVRYERARFTPMAFSAITTPAGMDFSDRLQRIYTEMTTLLTTHKPDAMAVEKLYFKNNQKTAIDVAQARGVILLAAKQAGVDVFEYTPLQVKSAVTGYGKAEKPQVMEMTRRLLRLPTVPKPDDTADALAIAICHGQTGGTALKRSLMK